MWERIYEDHFDVTVEWINGITLITSIPLTSTTTMLIDIGTKWVLWNIQSSLNNRIFDGRKSAKINRSHLIQQPHTIKEPILTFWRRIFVACKFWSCCGWNVRWINDRKIFYLILTLTVIRSGRVIKHNEKIRKHRKPLVVSTAQDVF